MAVDNIGLVRRFLEEVWNKGDMSVADELLSPKLKTYEPVMGELGGIDGAKQHIRLFRTAFPDLKITIDDIGAVGDKVFIRWTATGTHKGSLMGLQPTNRKGVIKGISLDRFENGKIVELFYAWDVYKLLENMGLVQPLSKLVPTAQPSASV